VNLGFQLAEGTLQNPSAAGADGCAGDDLNSGPARSVATHNTGRDQGVGRRCNLCRAPSPELARRSHGGISIDLSGYFKVKLVDIRMTSSRTQLQFRWVMSAGPQGIELEQIA